MYSALLLDHFEHPRNSGEVENSDARFEVSNPACGDVARLTVRVIKGRLAEIRFRAKGCVPAMACCSALTELAMGKTLEEASRIGREDVSAAVGGLPAASGHAAHLAIDALAGLLKTYHSNRTPEF